MPPPALTRIVANKAQGFLARPAHCHTQAAASCHGTCVATAGMADGVDKCGSRLLVLRGMHVMCEALWTQAHVPCSGCARVGGAGGAHAGAWAAMYAAKEQGMRSGVPSEPLCS